MVIKTAEYTISSPTVTMCPKDQRPEFAFIGRSNVGKSSLINMICNHKGLAKTSATPGKTLLINHFIINRDWYLVDLPGYGYAKRSKTERDKLDRMIRSYILQREELVNVFVLIDIRHEQQKIDREFVDWLGASNIPFSIIFTRPTSSPWARHVPMPRLGWTRSSTLGRRCRLILLPAPAQRRARKKCSTI